MPVKRNGERHRRGPEQKMDELRTGEIGRECRFRSQEQNRNQQDRDQDRIGDRIGRNIGDERHGEPEKRRAGKINPEVDEASHSAFSSGGASVPPTSFATQVNVSAVTASAMTVESTTTTSNRPPSAPKRSSCCTTPTPAGTNSMERCLRMPSAVSPIACGKGRRSMSAASKSTMPITGPGKGSERK